MYAGTLPRCSVSLIVLLLNACADTPKPATPLGEGPYSFHDTRLRYALLINDRKTLQADFAMNTEPTVTERIAAGFALPVTTATEIAAWPASQAFRAFYESAERERVSRPGKSVGTE